MTDPPTSSANPTEDVLAAIQDVIDTPRLPFPDRTVRRLAETDGLEARITKLLKPRSNFSEILRK